MRNFTLSWFDTPCAQPFCVHTVAHMIRYSTILVACEGVFRPCNVCAHSEFRTKQPKRGSKPVPQVPDRNNVGITVQHRLLVRPETTILDQRPVAPAPAHQPRRCDPSRTLVYPPPLSVLVQPFFIQPFFRRTSVSFPFSGVTEFSVGSQSSRRPLASFSRARAELSRRPEVAAAPAARAVHVPLSVGIFSFLPKPVCCSLQALQFLRQSSPAISVLPTRRL